MRLKNYFKVWWRTTSLSAEQRLVTRGASIMFVAGKVIRFIFFLFSLLVIFGKNLKVAGYNFDDLIIFFLVFNLMDMLGQIFFRGIYFFRRHIISGDFDYTLLKPINSLYWVLTFQTDILDLPLLIVVIFWLMKKIFVFPLFNIFLFFLLIGTGFLLILTIHILVACLGIITTEVDHAIWIFRDLSSTARVPTDIYAPFLRYFLTFIVPIAVIYTFPAKVLFNLLSWQWFFYAAWISSGLFLLSLKLWQWSLKKYSSASS